MEDTNLEGLELMRLRSDEGAAMFDEPFAEGGLRQGQRERLISRRKALALFGGAIIGVGGGFLTCPSFAGTQRIEVPGTMSDEVLSDYDRTVLAGNPVAYFRLDGSNVKDYSPRGHDGLYVGAPGTTTLPNGDTATVFDGSTQYAEVPDASHLSITKTRRKLTLEAWIRPDVLEFPKQEGSGYVHWMGKGERQGDDGQQEYASRVYSLTNSEDRPNRISGYAFNPDGDKGIGSYFQDPVAVGEWVHYVFVINTTPSDPFPQGCTKIYKNGVERDLDSLKNKDGLHIEPGNGTAPLRIGTREADPLKSFFKGAIGKVAVYGHELSGANILEHYQKMVWPLVGNVGHASSQDDGTTLTIPINKAIPTGRTLVTRVIHDYTAGEPTMSDTRGNTYMRDRSATNANKVIRASIFSSSITTALQPGDRISVNLPSAARTKVAVTDEFDRVLTGTERVDDHIDNDGNSTAPSASLITANAEDLLIGFVGVNGPADGVYSEDTSHLWTSLTRAGTVGGVGDKTIHGAYRSAHSAGEYEYSPTLGTSTEWIDFIVAYKVLNNAPEIRAVRPMPGSVTRDTTPRISAMVTDREDDLSMSSIELYVDGKPKTTFSYDQDTKRLSYLSGRLSYGRHTATVVARDKPQGPASTKKWGFRVVR